MRRPALATGAVASLLLLATACGGQQASSTADETGDPGQAAADTSTCVKDATAVSSTPAGYAKGFPLPKGTVVFHVEDRGADGVVATGVTATPFKQVLAAMNASRKAGFRVTSGETEADDAEANWTGNGYVGRWAIKKSATCPGETVVELLSKQAG